MLRQISLALFLWGLFLSGYSQSISLRDLFAQIEKDHDVVFSYVDELVQGVEISQPTEINFSLEQWLNYLSAQSDLKFDRLEGNIIAVTRRAAEPEEPKYLKICGYVKDGDTDESIPFATISAGRFSGVADESGFFQFDVIDAFPDSLVIRQVAYQPVTYPLNRSDCGKYLMYSRFSGLPELVVANYLVGGISRKPGGKIELKPNEQKLVPGLTEPDVLFTVQTLPGIVSVSESVSDINIRGGTNDQNLVLWDGIRMYQTGHFFGLISAFNPRATGTVGLIKNGTAASLGESVSGTILMETNVGSKDSVGGSAGINMLFADLNLHLPVDRKLAVGVSGRRSVTDWFESITLNKYADRAFQDSEVGDVSGSQNDFRFYDFTMGLTYKPGKLSNYAISAIRIANNLSFDEMDSVSSRNSELAQESSGLSFRSSHLISDILKISSNGYYSSYLLESRNNDRLTNQTTTRENEVTDFSAGMDVTWLMNDRIDLQVGYQYALTTALNQELRTNPNVTISSKQTLVSHAAFAEGHLTSQARDLELTLGMRLNMYPQLTEMFLEPRMALNYRLTDNWSFELLGELKNQKISQIVDFENDFLGVENRRWTLAGTNELPITRSAQFSLGAQWEKDNRLISLEGYVKNVADVSSRSQGFRDQLQLVDFLLDYVSYGADLLLRNNLKRGTLWLSYSLSKNDYYANLVISPFPNNLDVRHILFVGGTYELGRFLIGAGMNYHSGLPYTPATGDQASIVGTISYDQPNSGRLRSYIRIDLSSSYRFTLSPKVNGLFGFSIWNVTDNHNFINTYFRVNEANQIQKEDQLALGFTPNLNLRVNF